MSHIADTPAPPYYTVIFTSLRSAEIAGYDRTAQRRQGLRVWTLTPIFSF